MKNLGAISIVTIKAKVLNSPETVPYIIYMYTMTCRLRLAINGHGYKCNFMKIWILVWLYVDGNPNT